LDSKHRFNLNNVASSTYGLNSTNRLAALVTFDN